MVDWPDKIKRLNEDPVAVFFDALVKLEWLIDKAEAEADLIPQHGADFVIGYLRDMREVSQVIPTAYLKIMDQQEGKEGSR